VYGAAVTRIALAIAIASVLAPATAPSIARGQSAHVEHAARLAAATGGRHADPAAAARGYSRAMGAAETCTPGQVRSMLSYASTLFADETCSAAIRASGSEHSPMRAVAETCARAYCGDCADAATPAGFARVVRAALVRDFALPEDDPTVRFVAASLVLLGSAPVQRASGAVVIERATGGTVARIGIGRRTFRLGEEARRTALLAILRTRPRLTLDVRALDDGAVELLAALLDGGTAFAIFGRE
jgi:hypothetical protein